LGAPPRSSRRHALPAFRRIQAPPGPGRPHRGRVRQHRRDPDPGADGLLMIRSLLRFWETWFGEPLRKGEAVSLAYRQSEAGRRPDWKTITVLLTVAVSLTIQNYAPVPDWFEPVGGFIARCLGASETPFAVARLARLTWWAVVSILTYTALPVLVIKLGFR